MGTAIDVHQLVRTFGSVQALAGIDVKVQAGTIFGFLGPNGAGKTTTIHILLGILEPTSGEVRVLGHDPRTQAERIRSRSGALLEHHGLYERLSAEENLQFYARVHGMKGNDAKARIREVLETIELWDRRRQPVGTWSRGMKQKLAVVRAILHRPELVFLDEPTSGQDPKSAAAFRDLVQRLAKTEGTTVFLTTHNLGEAERLCDDVALIHEGRIVATGSPKELASKIASNRLVVRGQGFTAKAQAAARRVAGVQRVHAEHQSLIVELTHEAKPAKVVEALVRAGASVEEVQREQATLEAFFLDAVEEASA